MTERSTRTNGIVADATAPAIPLPDRRLRWPDPLIAAAAIALYLALEWLSFLHQHGGLPVTPWNPGLGLMLALNIIGGPGYAIVLFIGAVLAEILVLRSGLPLYVDIAVGAIVASAYGFVAFVLRGRLQLGGLDQQEFQTRDILLLLTGGLAGAVTAAALLCGLLLSLNHFNLGDIARTVTPLVLGDVIGIVVVTPLILRIHQLREKSRKLSLRSMAELAGFTFAVLALLMLTLGRPDQNRVLFYLLFLPVVVAAVRYGIDGACAALTIAQLVLVAALHYYGFDLNRFTEFQFLMLVLTLTGLVVGALVSERRLADDKAQAAAQRLHELQAESARMARLNLVSGMATALAHEINQPMTAARALARSVQELVRVPSGDRARAEKNIASMIEQIDHAANIVSRMREFLRRGERHVSTLDIRIVLTEALALVQPLAEEHRIAIDLAMPADMPVVFADRVQVQQVVINLVRNAVDAIADGRIAAGRIVVTATVSADAAEIEIAVHDNGPGIDSEQLDTLFDPLSTSRPDGIGLGLSICRTIIQSHGGRIWLSSSLPGRTEFRFTLPAGCAGGAKE